MVNRRVVITVDGLAASGKSTLASLLAARLGYINFNSGEIYRAFAFGYSNSSEYSARGYQPDDVLLYAVRNSILLHPDGKLEVDKQVLTTTEREYLRNPLISELTSKVSAYALVRERLFDVQRNAYEPNDIVAEGRDQGVIFADIAKVKFFITATPEVRAERRKKQQPAIDAQSLTKELTERDKRDTERLVSPTVPVPGAIIIENNGSDPEVILTQMQESVAVALSRK